MFGIRFGARKALSRRRWITQSHNHKQKVDSIIKAPWIIPVVPEGKVLHDHAILIRNGIIEDILPNHLAFHNYASTEIVDKPHHVVIPGLVNSHNHSPMTLFRGYADDLDLQSWLHDHIFPVENRWVSPNFVRDGSKLAIAEMIKSGTTCFTDMYFYPDETAEEALHVGMRAMIGVTIIKFPTSYAKTSEEYFRLAEESLSKYNNNPFINICVAPHAPYTVTDDQFTRSLKLAQKFNTPIMCHIHETQQEVVDSTKEHGIRPIERLRRLGIVNEKLIAVHCTEMDNNEIRLFKEAGTSVAHCPESNCKLGSGISPVYSMLQEGVNVCLGTDSTASNNELDMFGEMKMAAFLGKAISKDPKVMSAAEVLSMATINGAKAIKWDHKIGSLEKGKHADIVALNLQTVSTVPFYNPISLLVYSAGRECVSDVWIGGKRHVSNGQLLTYNEKELFQIAHHWGKQIAEQSKWKHMYSSFK